MYRTFVKLGEQELGFLRSLQRAHMIKLGKKTKPPLSKVLRGVILDYRDMVLGKKEGLDLSGKVLSIDSSEVPS